MVPRSQVTATPSGVLRFRASAVFEPHIINSRLCVRIRKGVPFYAAFFKPQTAMNSRFITAIRLAFSRRYRRFL